MGLEEGVQPADLEVKDSRGFREFIFMCIHRASIVVEKMQRIEII